MIGGIVQLEELLGLLHQVVKVLVIEKLVLRLLQLEFHSDELFLVVLELPQHGLERVLFLAD